MSRSLVFIAETELLASPRLSSKPENLAFFEAVDMSVWVSSRGGAWNDSQEAIDEFCALREMGKRVHLHASFAEGDLDGDLEVLAGELLSVIADFGGCDLFLFNTEKAWLNGENINEKMATLAAMLRARGIPAIGYSGHRYPPWTYGSGTEDLDPDMTAQTFDELQFMAYHVKDAHDSKGEPWIGRKLREGEETAVIIGLPLKPLIGTGRFDTDGACWGWVEVTEDFLVSGDEAKTVHGASAYFAYGSRTNGQDTLWEGSLAHLSIAEFFACLDFGDADPADLAHLENADNALRQALDSLVQCKVTGAVRRATNATTNARAATARAMESAATTS